jgi:C1A family cysteine protease
VAQSKHYQPKTALSVSQAFDEFNQFWNRTHATPLERQERFRNFVMATHKIAEMNKNSRRATFGYSKYADWSAEEFKKLLGFRPAPGKTLNPIPSSLVHVEMPSSPIDWVAKGKTTPIKNQEQCGSCWAFSATETVESANLMANHPMVIGGPQEIVDCDTNDDACQGGDPQEALQWVVNQGGQDTERCYPYTGQNGNCASSQCTPNTNLKISTVTPIAGNEPAIYQALVGMPLSICCDAEPWQYYTGGILDADQCGTSIDHAIQLTGYSPNQGGYWVVRNSWGADWGENGFIWLQYGQNTCGITSEVTAASV